MTFRRNFAGLALVTMWLVAVMALSPQAMAQGVNPATFVNPPTDSWPTFNGDYTGQRHSPLTQITPENVSQLSLAWAFEPGVSIQMKATPILVDGVLYVTAPDNLWSIDARSGRQL